MPSGRFSVTRTKNRVVLGAHILRQGLDPVNGDYASRTVFTAESSSKVYSFYPFLLSLLSFFFPYIWLAQVWLFVLCTEHMASCSVLPDHPIATQEDWLLRFKLAPNMTHTLHVRTMTGEGVPTTTSASTQTTPAYAIVFVPESKPQCIEKEKTTKHKCVCVDRGVHGLWGYEGGNKQKEMNVIYMYGGSGTKADSWLLTTDQEPTRHSNAHASAGYLAAN